MKRNFLKIFITLVLIGTIKTSFLVSNAFLGEDLGLNLYKQIDSGIGNLEELNYNYELHGQNKNGKIEDEINEILENRGFGNCKIAEGISRDELNEIVDGKIDLLYNKLSDECKFSESIKISVLNAMNVYVKNYKNNTLEKAREKSKQTYEISRIGIYYDGDTKNSPFDVVKDIQDIDYIVFTQEIEYEGENNIDDKGLNDYLLGKFRDTESKWNKKLNPSSKSEHEKSSSSYEESNITYDNTGIANILPLYLGENDGTKYMCPQHSKESGLADEDLENLLSNSGYGGEGTQSGGIETGSGESDSDFIFPMLDTGYGNVTDDSMWKCSDFFCITIEFIIHKHSVFGNEKMRSIQSIVEKSNEHLKKFANSSLIQSKMTINNFESPLRDLNLPNILSFGLVVTKKTPPILDLEYAYKDKKSIDENDDFSRKSLFCKRWEALGLNCKRENDLSIFSDSDAEQKTINDGSELTLKQVTQKYEQRRIFLREQALVDDFISKAIQRDALLNDTNELYEEFLELEKFVRNMQDYSFDLNAIVKSMLEIPIHP